MIETIPRKNMKFSIYYNRYRILKDLVWDSEADEVFDEAEKLFKADQSYENLFDMHIIKVSSSLGLFSLLSV